MFESLPSDWNALLESFNDPQKLHAIMVHIPIAVAALGLLLVLGVAITGGKSAGLRWTTVFIYTFGVLAALWAVDAGDQAVDALDDAKRVPASYVTAEQHEHTEGETEEAEADESDPGIIMHRHEELGRYFWVGLAIVGVLIMLAAIRVTWWKSLVIFLAILVGAANVVWVGVIAHYGGEMVYQHQIGVPSPASQAPETPVVDPDPDKDKSTTDKQADKVADKSNDADKDKTEPVKDKDPGERDLPKGSDKDKSIFD